MSFFRLAILAGLLLGIAAGVGAFTFVYAKGASYLTNDPTACANCHIMEEHFAAWTKSSHHAVAVCNDCHTPKGLVPKYLTKASNGFWHSVAFTTGRFPDPLRIKQHNHEITERACRKCHEQITAAIDIAAHAGAAGEYETDDRMRSQEHLVLYGVLVEESAALEEAEHALQQRALEAKDVVGKEVGRLVEDDAGVVALGEDAVQDDDMEVEVGVEGGAEAVEEGDGAEPGVAWSAEPGVPGADGLARRSVVRMARSRMRSTSPARRGSWCRKGRIRSGRDSTPLADGQRRQHVVGAQCRELSLNQLRRSGPAAWGCRDALGLFPARDAVERLELTPGSPEQFRAF